MVRKDVDLIDMGGEKMIKMVVLECNENRVWFSRSFVGIFDF